MNDVIAGFDWDEGNWPKCGKHGVPKDEIEHVLSSRPLVLADRYPHDVETRFDAVGMNQSGRYVFAVFTLREREDKRYIRPLSARYVHEKEIRNYERQRGKKT